MEHYNVTQEEFDAAPDQYKVTLGYAAATLVVNYAEVFQTFSKRLEDYLQQSNGEDLFSFLRRFSRDYEQIQRKRIRTLTKKSFQKKRSQSRKWHKYKKRG